MRPKAPRFSSEDGQMLQPTTLARLVSDEDANKYESSVLMARNRLKEIVGFTVPSSGTVRVSEIASGDKPF